MWGEDRNQQMSITGRYLLQLFLVLVIGLGTASSSYSQSAKRFGGTHTKNKRKSSGAKRKGGFKGASKKNRKAIKKRRSNAQHARKKTLKRTTSVRKKSVSKNKKSRNYRGSYPSSKHQFGTKIELLVAGGVVLNNNLIGSATNTQDNLGLDKQFIAEGSVDNTTGYNLGLGLLYHLSNHLGIYTDVHVSRMPQENSFIDLTGVGLYGKLNINSYKKKTSIYLFGGISVDNWNYEYRDFFVDEAFTNSGATDFATVTSVQTQYDKYTSGSEIMYGYKLGFGIDYQISRNLGSFIQAGYSQNNSEKFNFTISNVVLDLGVKIALKKNKSLY